MGFVMMLNYLTLRSYQCVDLSILLNIGPCFSPTALLKATRPPSSVLVD